LPFKLFVQHIRGYVTLNVSGVERRRSCACMQTMGTDRVATLHHGCRAAAAWGTAHAALNV
jgi:hypothetical protein